jgi:hypothetical protein
MSDFSRALTDNITSNQVILWMLSQLGGIVPRGGKTIVEPLIIDDNASVHWYSGYDPLDMTNNEGITSAEYAWKQLAGVAQLSGIEKAQNAGSTQLIDLMDAKGKQLGLSMRRAVNQAIPSDGSADGGKALVGLLSAVENGDTFTTYGTIDSATTTNWQNQWLDGGAYSTSTNFLDGLRRIIMLCSAGTDRPHLGITTQTLYAYFLSLLEAKEQFIRVATDEWMANAGFENIVYMGVPITWDENMLPNTTTGSTDDAQGLVVLNLDYAKLVIMNDYEFSFTEPQSPNNQDAESWKCLLYTNLVLSNRRRQGRVNYDTP